MADIGKRNGVAIIFGIKSHGFIAWWMWRTYYLANMPTISKKMKVMIDWTLHYTLSTKCCDIRDKFTIRGRA